VDDLTPYAGVPADEAVGDEAAFDFHIIRVEVTVAAAIQEPSGHILGRNMVDATLAFGWRMGPPPEGISDAAVNAVLSQQMSPVLALIQTALTFNGWVAMDSFEVGWGEPGAVLPRRLAHRVSRRLPGSHGRDGAGVGALRGHEPAILGTPGTTARRNNSRKQPVLTVAQYREAVRLFRVEVSNVAWSLVVEPR